MERYELEGIFTSQERVEIENRILEIVNSEKYGNYFAPNLKVISERDIMISENFETKVLRPDRLIATENGFIIIDFKTGAPKEADQLQVDNYKIVLEKLGKKVSETLVIYV